MRKLTLALSTAALAMSGAAFAQTAPTPGKARAPMADMTRAQAQAKAEAHFARMDTDRNGEISRAEFGAMHAKHAERGHKAGMAHGKGGHHGMMGEGKEMMAKEMAMAHDKGPISRQAFVDRVLSMFDRADANRDGTVTVAERKAARETMRGHWRARAAERQQG